MAITKPQFKQVVVEYLLKEEDLVRKVQDNEDYVTKLRLAVSDLYQHYRELNADIDDLRIDLNDYMSTGEKPSRFAEPDVIPGAASMSINTNPGGKPMMEKLKLTKSQLMNIIKEEIGNALKEMDDNPALHSSAFELLTTLEDMGYTDPNSMRQVLESALMSLQDSEEQKPWAPELGNLPAPGPGEPMQ